MREAACMFMCIKSQRSLKTKCATEATMRRDADAYAREQHKMTEVVSQERPSKVRKANLKLQAAVWENSFDHSDLIGEFGDARTLAMPRLELLFV